MAMAAEFALIWHLEFTEVEFTVLIMWTAGYK